MEFICVYLNVGVNLAVLKGPWIIMKTKEHSKKVWDTIMEMYKAGLNYKTIFQTVNIWQNAVKSKNRKNIAQLGGKLGKERGDLSGRRSQEVSGNSEAAEIHNSSYSSCWQDYYYLCFPKCWPFYRRVAIRKLEEFLNAAFHESCGDKTNMRENMFGSD